MSSVNKVIILGNLGTDPEVRSFQSGDKVCNLRVATSEKWKDKNSGEQRERTEWHAVSIFGDGLVRIAEQYLRKGSKCYIEGQLQTRKWQDKEGHDRWSTEVVVKGFGGTLVLLGDKSQGDSRDDYSNASQGGESDNSGGGGNDFYEDSIPFGPEWRI